MLQRTQQRAPDQVVGTEQVVLAQRRAVRVGEPDAEQLARVVPLVQRLGGVDPVVALQPDQRRVEDRRERLARLGLADAGLALQQQRLRKAEAEEHRGRQALVHEVVHLREPLRQRLDVGREVAQLARCLSGDVARAHCGGSARPCIAAQTRAGLHGMSMWSTPCVSCSASITALTIAGGDPTLGDSPTPFAPSG